MSRGGQLSPIHLFNQQNRITDLFQKYGYKKVCITTTHERWLSPFSKSKKPGIIVWPEKGEFYSHHSSCVFNDGHKHDCFDLFQHSENLSLEEALSQASKTCCAPDRRSIKEYNRDIYLQQRTKDLKKSATITKEESYSSVVEYQRLSDVETKPMNWIWKGKFARGKFGVIAGLPGVGKSQLVANFAATITTGGAWPDGSKCDRGSVIILSSEDDPSDTIKPRFEAAGADSKYVCIIKSVLESSDKQQKPKIRQFSLDADIQNLSKAIDTINSETPECKVSLVVIDPISAYMGNINSNNNSEVRGLLTTVSDMGRDKDVAILGISHLTKDANNKTIMRVIGSQAFVAAARCAFLVAKDDEDKNKRLFLHLKNNLANDQIGHSFHIEERELIGQSNKIVTSRIVWTDEVVSKTADQVMEENKDTGDLSALEEAKDFLLETLSNGPILAKKVKETAENAGISGKTLFRAKNELKIISDKEKAVSNGAWFWTLPQEVNQFITI